MAATQKLTFQVHELEFREALDSDVSKVKVTAYVGALLSQKQATKFVKVPKKGDRTTLTFKDKPLALGDFTGSDLRSSDQITIGAYAKTKSGGSDYTVLGTCLFNLASIKDNSKSRATLTLSRITEGVGRLKVTLSFGDPAPGDTESLDFERDVLSDALSASSALSSAATSAATSADATASCSSVSGSGSGNSKKASPKAKAKAKAKANGKAKGKEKGKGKGKKVAADPNHFAVPVNAILAPAKVEGEIAGKEVVSIAFGRAHMVAIIRGGRVYTWGENNYGQLGTGDTRPRWTPRRVNALKRVKAVTVYARDDWTMVVTEDGELMTFGRNTGMQGIGVPDIDSADASDSGANVKSDSSSGSSGGKAKAKTKAKAKKASSSSSSAYSGSTGQQSVFSWMSSAASSSDGGKKKGKAKAKGKKAKKAKGIDADSKAAKRLIALAGKAKDKVRKNKGKSS